MTNKTKLLLKNNHNTELFENPVKKNHINRLWKSLILILCMCFLGYANHVYAESVSEPETTLLNTIVDIAETGFLDENDRFHNPDWYMGTLNVTMFMISDTSDFFLEQI